jgi:hypothetical protein
MARFHHDTHLKPPLLEAPGLAMLNFCWKPSSVFDRRPMPCHGWRREAGQENRW